MPNPPGKFPNLPRLVKDYQTTRARKFDELALYREVPLREAIALAALAKVRNKNGDLVRHSHQTRVPQRSLEAAKERLAKLRPALARCQSFEELHDTVSSIRRPPSPAGIGDLAIYDMCLRIGASRGLEPTRVYLHCAARDGARALGLDARAPVLPMSALPAPMRRLSAREAEDFLAVYAAELGGGEAPSPRPRSRPALTPARKH